jgi:hypothetical protein
MTRRLFPPLLMMLMALLISSAPAGAAQLDLVGRSSDYRYQEWADQSYAPTYPGAVQLTFSPALITCGTAGGAVGCTDWSGWPTPHVTIDAGEGPDLAHKYLMHELGHVFDATEMQDPFRVQFMAIWGRPGGAGAWWTRFGSANASAGEWFAESYRLCALYGPQMPYRAWMSDSPSYGFPGDRESAKQDASCRLILNVGVAGGLAAPASPALYAPRTLVDAHRKAAECRGMDLLVVSDRVRCERVGGGAPAGQWNVVLQARRMTRAQLSRAHLTAIRGRPAFALVGR